MEHLPSQGKPLQNPWKIPVSLLARPCRSRGKPHCNQPSPKAESPCGGMRSFYAPCFLHPALPTANALAPSHLAFFIFLPFPVLLLSHFGQLLHCFQVLDCLSAWMRSLCPRASVKPLLLSPQATQCNPVLRLPLPNNPALTCLQAQGGVNQVPSLGL